MKYFNICHINNYINNKLAKAQVIEKYSFVIIAIVFVILGYYRIDLRTKITLIGYEIANLKEQEAILLEDNSRLKMNYEKLTAKANLAELGEIDLYHYSFDHTNLSSNASTTR